MNGRIAPRLTSAIRYILLILGALMMLVPFLYMLGTSFKPHAFVLELPPSFIPSQPTLDNYRTPLTTNQFGRYF